MNQYYFFIALFLATAAVSAIDPANPCAQGAAWSDDTFNALINGMSQQTYEDNRFAYLLQQTNTSSLAFSGAQALALSKQFTFVSNKNRMFRDLSAYWLGMTCSDVTAILKDLTFYSDQLEILPILVDITLDLSTQNDTIVKFFPSSFSQEDARQIIANAKPFSCIFGRVLSPRVVFILETSLSMRYPFSNPADGQNYTRLQYAVQDLSNVISKLASYQEFNILSFDNYAYQFQPAIVPATPQNIQGALTYLSKRVADGFSVMIPVMKLAFADPDVAAVYMLTDSAPDASTQNTIITLAQQWVAAVPNRVVNTISFQPGGAPNQNAAAFMAKLAATTGGITRFIN